MTDGPGGRLSGRVLACKPVLEPDANGLPQGEPTWNETWRAVRVPFLLSRVLLHVVVYLGLCFVAVPSVPELWRTFPDNLWLDGLARWDAGFYASIGIHGHQWLPDRMNNCAFFPLVPILTRILSLPLTPYMAADRAFFIALFALSPICFFIGLCALYPMARQQIGASGARKAVWLLCFFPFSYFFDCAYSEGVFFALLTWTFNFARQGRLTAACLVAMVNCWSRIPGLFAAFALGVEILHARWRRLGREAWPLPLLAGPVLLLIYYDVVVGHPIAFYTAQTFFRDDSVRSQLTHLWSQSAGIILYNCCNLVMICLALTASVPIARRYHLSWGLLTFLSIIVPACTDLRALGRYASVIFPFFIAAADSWGRARFFAVAVTICGALMLYFAFGFSHWQKMY